VTKGKRSRGESESPKAVWPGIGKGDEKTSIDLREFI